MESHLFSLPKIILTVKYWVTKYKIIYGSTLLLLIANNGVWMFWVSPSSCKNNAKRLVNTTVKSKFIHRRYNVSNKLQTSYYKVEMLEQQKFSFVCNSAQRTWMPHLSWGTEVLHISNFSDSLCLHSDNLAFILYFSFIVTSVKSGNRVRLKWSFSSYHSVLSSMRNDFYSFSTTDILLC